MFRVIMMTDGNRKLNYEWTAWGKGILNVVGVDEAGRGPIAGPVVAAAVVFAPGCSVDGVRDSKQLTPRVREELAVLINRAAVDVAIGCASIRVIDRCNILVATRLAMIRALDRLTVDIGLVMIDGRPVPDLIYDQWAIIGGDHKSDSIAAASIIAKVWRDRLMDKLHVRYPQYGFARNRGYATAEHRSALAEFGPCPQHRRTFAPVCCSS